MRSLPGEFGSALPVSPGVIKLLLRGDQTMQMSGKIDGFLETYGTMEIHDIYILRCLGW